MRNAWTLFAETTVTIPPAGRQEKILFSLKAIGNERLANVTCIDSEKKRKEIDEIDTKNPSPLLFSSFPRGATEVEEGKLRLGGKVLSQL